MSIENQILLRLYTAYICIIIALCNIGVLAKDYYCNVVENNYIVVTSIIVSVMGLLSQNQHREGMQLINTGSTLAEKGEHEKRKKYLPYFIWKPFKIMPDILITIGIIMSALTSIK